MQHQIGVSIYRITNSENETFIFKVRRNPFYSRTWIFFWFRVFFEREEEAATKAITESIRR